MKKLYYGCWICIALLVITNPSLSDFKEYKLSNYIDKTSERDINFFVCSIYKRKYTYFIDNGRNKHIYKTYLGFLGNFFLLSDIKER
jgi:hypothetical protein